MPVVSPELVTLLDALALPRQPVAIAVGGAWRAASGPPVIGRSPIDGRVLTQFSAATAVDVSPVVAASAKAFDAWRLVPAPRRGELVRQIGLALRDRQSLLADLVTLETGKITSEARGEIQEMIDVCDFAVGLSRQLYGLSIASERPQHRLTEQWHPLGPVGVISAFNFPVAVWAWNAMIALVCGDTVVWKPSEKTPLSAMACQAIVARVAAETAIAPPEVSSLIVGTGPTVGHALAANPGLPLISATGSVPMGRAVAQTVAARIGRSLLELGGNNAIVVTPSADVELATRGIVFAAAGTCGQRCTTARRLVVHESILDDLIGRLLAVYARLPIGDPRADGVLVGPLIDQSAWEAMQRALGQARAAGGQVHGGERVTEGVPASGFYVRPAMVLIEPGTEIVRQETFAPILYVMKYRSFPEAIAIVNDVPQGLAASVFTLDVREAELFCSAAGAHCGIVNVNIGTSGAEIGGAFGGEKETGGGRESGSDAWKAYMRRTTNTINFSNDLPLAQGVRFDV
ncbi:MAG TPA: aldehyde dehydrogenase family protein [Pirellulales bacterium]|jgi:aldehyde dehydrogenase (NAD+)|nr:aldehyde dehydrogenase family protein [Pirellulales bacterium]